MKFNKENRVRFVGEKGPSFFACISFFIYSHSVYWKSQWNPIQTDEKSCKCLYVLSQKFVSLMNIWDKSVMRQNKNMIYFWTGDIKYIITVWSFKQMIYHRSNSFKIVSPKHCIIQKRWETGKCISLLDQYCSHDLKWKFYETLICPFQWRA